MDLKRGKQSPIVLAIIVILGILAFIALGIRFEETNLFSRLIMSFIIILTFFYAYRRNFSTLALAFLTGASIFIALVNSFADPYTGSSPIALSIVLGAWPIFIISLLASLAVIYWYSKSNYENKYPLILFVVYILVWILLSINVAYFQSWILENVLTIPFLILIYLGHRWFRLSNLSYSLIFIFMTLHVIGTHYTYAEVPFGFWLQDLFGHLRNHYDRIVHFSFGLLFAYSMREITIRISNAKGFWSYYLPVEFVLAFSAIYEIIEWIIAIIFGGDLGIAYLGSQGDPWDGIKDMALAGLGSVITMLVVLIVRVSYDPRGFWSEFKESLRVKDKNVLGEVMIAKLQKRS